MEYTVSKPVIVPFKFEGKKYQLSGTKRFEDVEDKIEEEDPSNPWHMLWQDEAEHKKFRIVFNMPSGTTFYMVGLLKDGETDVKLKNVGEFVLYYDNNGKQKHVGIYDVHNGLTDILYGRNEWPLIDQISK
jgi:hypothetical protein